LLINVNQIHQQKVSENKYKMVGRALRSKRLAGEENDKSEPEISDVP
jgi:hypothetical protein